MPPREVVQKSETVQEGQEIIASVPVPSVSAIVLSVPVATSLFQALQNQISEHLEHTKEIQTMQEQKKQQR